MQKFLKKVWYWLCGITDLANASKIRFLGFTEVAMPTSIRIRWHGLNPERIHVYRSYGVSPQKAKVDFIGNAIIIKGTKCAVLDEPNVQEYEGLFVVFRFKNRYDASTFKDVEIEMEI